jgi:hypothetical protein
MYVITPPNKKKKCQTCSSLQHYSIASFDYLLFYVPLKNISHILRCHHYRWRAAKFRHMLGAQDLYSANPAVTRNLCFFPGLIRRTAPFSRLLRHTRGCGGSILTSILTGSQCWILKQNLSVFIIRLFLCFSVLRPRAGRFWTKNVAKQTKEICMYKNAFLWNFHIILLWMQRSCNALN